jgi:hypothetical protein
LSRAISALIRCHHAATGAALARRLENTLAARERRTDCRFSRCVDPARSYYPPKCTLDAAFRRTPTGKSSGSLNHFELPSSQNMAVTSYNSAFRVDQHRVYEAEFPDTAGDFGRLSETRDLTGSIAPLSGGTLDLLIFRCGESLGLLAIEFEYAVTRHGLDQQIRGGPHHRVEPIRGDAIKRAG